MAEAHELMPELDRQVALASRLIANEHPEQRARYEAETKAQTQESTR